jgi:hypothetical protein
MNPMNQPPIYRSEARVPTPRGERYARQLCSHAAHMASRAEWTPPEGRIEFPDDLGTCRILTDPGHLILTLQATDPASLGRLQQIIGSNITRFASREGLNVEWAHPSDR